MPHAAAFTLHRFRPPIALATAALFAQGCATSTTIARRTERGPARTAEVPVEQARWPYKVETTVVADGVLVQLSALQCVTQTSRPIKEHETRTHSPSLWTSIALGAVGAGLVGFGVYTWGRRDRYPAECPFVDDDCVTRADAEAGAIVSGSLGALAIGFGTYLLFKPPSTEERIVADRIESNASTPHACPTPISPIPVELYLPNGTPLRVMTDANGRAHFPLPADWRAVWGLGAAANVMIAGQMVTRGLRLDGSTEAMHVATTSWGRPELLLGAATASDGCIPGYAYPVKDAAGLDTDYSSVPPAAELYGCRWHFALGSSVGAAGLQPGAWYVVRHQGVFAIPSTGYFSFPLRSPYGYRLSIDDKIVSNAAGTNEVQLNAGQHTMLLEYLYRAGSPFDFQLLVGERGGAPRLFQLGRQSPYYAAQTVRYVGTAPLRSDYERLATVDRKEIKILQQVHFKTDSDEILRDDDSEAVLFAVAKIMSEHPEIARVEIQGHTDDQGAADHNLDLSNRRSEAVRKWLVQAGIAPHRLVARGYGKTQPIAPNTSAAGRALNRRVQFVIEGSAAVAGGSAGTATGATTASAAASPGTGVENTRIGQLFGALIGRDASLGALLPESIGEYRRLEVKGEVRERGRIISAGYATPRFAMLVLVLMVGDEPFPPDVRKEFTTRIAGFPAEREGEMALLLASKRTAVAMGAMGGPAVDAPTMVLKSVNLKALAKRAEAK